MPVRKQIEYKINENGCHICISHKARTGGPVNYIPYWNPIFKKYTLLHRFVYEQKYGKIPKGKVVRHKCDNSLCINPEHLELGTRADNVQDRIIRNRSAIGEKHGRSKLTEQEVEEIFLNNKLSYTKLAERYNISRIQIYKIKNRITWKHITNKLIF